MQLTVSGTQVELSDALRDRVAQHLDVIAGKYFDHALEASVTFSRARSFFTCDINVHAGRGLTLRGEGEDPVVVAAEQHRALCKRRTEGHQVVAQILRAFRAGDLAERREVP